LNSKENQIYQNPKIVNIMKNEQWNLILPQAVEHFSSHIREKLEVSPNYYEKNPDDWLTLESPLEMYEYIMGDEYWVYEWANFLLATLIHELYQQSLYEFNR